MPQTTGQPDIARVQVLFYTGTETSLAEVNNDFPQSFQAMAGVMPLTEP
jgi:hypothetical protein